MRINWENYRVDFGALDLVEAYKYYNPSPSEEVVNFLNRITVIQPITSRQVAAHILASVLSDEQVAK